MGLARDGRTRGAHVGGLFAWASRQVVPVLFLASGHLLPCPLGNLGNRNLLGFKERDVDNEMHQPEGLNEVQLARLEEHVRRGQLLAPDRLLQAAYAHLEDVQSAQGQHPEIDAALAESICHVLDRVVSEWDGFSPSEQSWLRGALRYFTKSDDEQHDFEIGGFRDDLEVLNACLRFAHRSDWVLPAGPGPS